MLVQVTNTRTFFFILFFLQFLRYWWQGDYVLLIFLLSKKLKFFKRLIYCFLIYEIKEGDCKNSLFPSKCFPLP